MSRFKELRRIEAALKNKDEKEILWAIGYSKTRLKYHTMKHRVKYWQKMLDKLNDAINIED